MSYISKCWKLNLATERFSVETRVVLIQLICLLRFPQLSTSFSFPLLLSVCLPSYSYSFSSSSTWTLPTRLPRHMPISNKDQAPKPPVILTQASLRAKAITPPTNLLLNLIAPLVPLRVPTMASHLAGSKSGTRQIIATSSKYSLPFFQSPSGVLRSVFGVLTPQTWLKTRKSLCIMR